MSNVNLNISIQGGSGDDLSRDDKSDVFVRRHKLTVHNSTHQDLASVATHPGFAHLRTDKNVNGAVLTDDGLGRFLKIRWERDVDSPPQHSFTPFGQSDWFKSRGIGSGFNTRYFKLKGHHNEAESSSKAAR